MCMEMIAQWNLTTPLCCEKIILELILVMKQVKYTWILFWNNIVNVLMETKYERF